MQAQPAPAASDPGPSSYLLALVAAPIAVVVAMLARHWAGLSDLSMVFMLAVLLVASRSRTGPALLTALLCFLGYNFFFIAPQYTLYIDGGRDLATMVLFLAAALLAGRLAARLAMQVRALRNANRQAQARQALTSRLATATDADTVLTIATEEFSRWLSVETWIRTEQACEFHVHAWRPSAPEHGWWFIPLLSGQMRLGEIGLKLQSGDDTLPPEARRLAMTLADDVAQALERMRLTVELQTQRLSTETERLRSALLSSVSHDLRTPLATIIGAAESLERYGTRMQSDDHIALLQMIRGEGERLDRYIQNLLDMTRLGNGTLALERDWIGFDELLGAALARLRRQHLDTRFTVSLPADLGPIWVQPALLEQALINVLDNAAKFSPPGTAVQLRAHQREADMLDVDILDQGPGVPADEHEQVFDMFYTASRGDRGQAGTGLGLAIARAIVTAHEGRIEMRPGPDGRGTQVSIHLPVRTALEELPA